MAPPTRCRFVKPFLTPLPLHYFFLLTIPKAVPPYEDQAPVVQSVVSLTSSLRVISLTVLADSIHNILIFFAEKM